MNFDNLEKFKNPFPIFKVNNFVDTENYKVLKAEFNLLYENNKNRWVEDFTGKWLAFGERQFPGSKKSIRTKIVFYFYESGL